MDAFKKKIQSKNLVLRVEDNKTFEIVGFSAEDFLKSLKKVKKTKLVEPVKILKEADVDLLETLPPHFYAREDELAPDGEGMAEHQRIVVNYLNVNTPYRGLLLYHGLGAESASVAVAESTNATIVYVLTPRSENFKAQIKRCGGDIDKFRVSSFAMEDSSNPFEDAVVIIDEVHRFALDDPKMRRVYEWIMDATCRVVALSSTPVVTSVAQLGIIFNMVRGRVKMFRVEEDWSAFANTVRAHRDVDGVSIIVRNPPGYVNVVEEGRIIGVKKGEWVSDAEFQEKTSAKTKSVNPFPITDKEFLKLSEEGFKRRIAGLVAYFPIKHAPVKPTVLHLVKASKSAAMVASLGKRSLIFTPGFKNVKGELEEHGFSAYSKQLTPKTYVEYTDEKNREFFNKGKVGVFLLDAPDDIEVDVPEIHMAGVDYFEQLCSRTAVTPHVYLTSDVDEVICEDALTAKTPDEKKFKALRDAKESVLPWIACMRETAIDCTLHGLRCYTSRTGFSTFLEDIE